MDKRAKNYYKLSLLNTYDWYVPTFCTLKIFGQIAKTQYRSKLRDHRMSDSYDK